MKPLFIYLLSSFLFIGNLICQKVNYTSIRKYIPLGFSILDSASGDFSGDFRKDLIIILKNNKEDSINDSPRPLLIFLGNHIGGYTLVGKNSNVVLCKGCGGVFGDPFQDIKIKSHYFSIEHYGGDYERWSRIITFKFDMKDKKIRLHKDSGDVYQLSTPKKVSTHLYNKNDFDKIEFKDYSNEKDE